MKRMPLFPFVCVLALLLATSCKDIKEVQYTGVKGFRVHKLDVSGMSADVTLGIRNPNDFGFSIYKSVFDVSYNGVKLGKARLSKRVHIGAGAERNYDFNLKSDFKDANLADVMKLLGSSGRGNLEIKGDLKAGKFLLRKKFPVNVKERVSLDR